MECLPEVCNDLFPVELTIETIHFRQLVLKFLEVTFGKASHDDKPTKFTFLLALNEPQYCVYALLLCIPNEAAGVHNGNLTFRIVGIMCYRITAQLQLMDEFLAVNKVFAAAEGDDVYSAGFHFLNSESTNSRRLNG